MEDQELNDFLKDILRRHQDICLEFERDFEETAGRLDKILFAPTSDLQSINDNTDRTPQQLKKRTKRLSTIIAADDEDNTIYSNNDTNFEESAAQSELGTSRRPHRAAKSNLDFKEPPLNKKCRRPSNFNEVSNNKKKIKEEQIHNTTNTKNNNKSLRTDKQGEISKKTDHIVEQMEIDENQIDDNKLNKILADESIVIVQKNEAYVEIPDSDNEIEIMPPPQTMPLKKNLRNKQAKPCSSDSTTVTQSQLEQSSLVNGTTEINVENSFKEAVVKIEKLSLEVPIEKTKQLEISKNNKSRSTKSKKKGRKQVPKPIKEEIITSENIDEQILASKRITRSNTSKQIQSEKSEYINAAASLVVSKSVKNISLESVYEDAIPTNDYLEPQSITDQKQIAITEIRSISKEFENEMRLRNNNNNGKSSIDDTTFISAKDMDQNIAVSLSDATFVAQSNLITAQSTFIMAENQNINNATMIMNDTQCFKGPIANGDATFNVVSSGEKIKNNIPLVRDSIMTDDDSDNDVPLKYLPKMKSHLNRKELFNPCVQSPVKKKVEAFEKQAINNINSPIPQRQTRTKTRAKQAKENAEPEIQGTIEKSGESIKHKQVKEVKEKLITPLIGRQIARLITPSQQSNITPGISGFIKKQPSSTSKIIGIQKSLQSAVSKTVSTYRTPSQSRENSVEDLKRYGIKLQEQVEERKKKRELKQQQAQQVRERKEKERADNLKRIMEERDDKARRKAAEAEQKRQLDEINRQLKFQEDKRDQQKRIERQKQLEREAAEIARKEREMLENLKIQKAKEKMQLKYDQNKKQLQQKKNANNNGPIYDFDMLQSDDSTDDEAVEKTNRPPVPAWSKNPTRQILCEKQAHVPTKIIDSFFSVQPLTPDLTDIFPSIHPKYLKRNSSVIWKTPPRYSQLPKRQ